MPYCAWLRTVTAFLIIFNLVVPASYAGFAVAPAKEYKLNKTMPPASTPAFTPAATTTTVPDAPAASPAAAVRTFGVRTYALQNRPSQTLTTAAQPVSSPATARVVPASDPAPSANARPVNPLRKTPLADRQQGAPAPTPQETPQPQPVSKPVASATVTSQPVNLISAFSTPLALPGPRNQDSPGDAAASLVRLAPQQQAERINSLSAYDAARVFTYLNQDQIDQLMAQPNLSSDLVGRIRQFITPESFFSLTRNWESGQLVAALQYPDLTPEARAQILESAPQAAGALESLLENDPGPAALIFDALTGTKQAEILSQIDGADAAALLAQKQNNDLFVRLSPEKQNEIIGKMLEIDSTMAHRYLDGAISVPGGTVDHPALFVNGMSRAQLAELLSSSPKTLALTLADSQLDAQTRQRLVEIFKEEFSEADVSGYLTSANPAQTGSSAYAFYQALNIYAGIDPEGAEALKEELLPALQANQQARQEFVLTQLTSAQPDAAGALLARDDITAAQAADLLLEATPQQRQELLDALAGVDSRKAEQTQSMITRLQELQAQQAQIKANNEKVEAQLKQIGPERVASVLLKHPEQEYVNALALMDQGFIDQTLSFLSGDSPETASKVRDLLTNTRQSNSSEPSTLSEQCDILLDKTPEEAALIIAQQNPSAAQALFAGLKQRNAGFAGEMLAALEVQDYQLAQQVRAEAPAGARETLNQYGQVIKIDGNDVFSKRVLADGSVYYSRIGTYGDSMDTTELADGQKPLELSGRQRISTQEAPDHSYIPQNSWYDPVNKEWGDQYGIYPVNPNRYGVWQQKQVIALKDGTRLYSADAVAIDPKTGLPPLGTFMYSDSGDDMYVIQEITTLRGTKATFPVEVKTYKAGEQVVIPMSNGTSRTFTAAEDFTLWPDSRGSYDWESLVRNGNKIIP